MNEWLFMMGLIAVMILVLGIFAVMQAKKQRELQKQHPGYPKGHWMNYGLSIGIALGAGIGVALSNLAIGVAIGVGTGTAIGAGLEKKHQAEMRPLTPEEEKLKKQSILFAIGTLMVGLVVFVITYFVAK